MIRCEEFFEFFAFAIFKKIIAHTRFKSHFLSNDWHPGYITKIVLYCIPPLYISNIFLQDCKDLIKRMHIIAFFYFIDLHIIVLREVLGYNYVGGNCRYKLLKIYWQDIKWYKMFCFWNVHWLWSRDTWWANKGVRVLIPRIGNDEHSWF